MVNWNKKAIEMTFSKVIVAILMVLIVFIVIFWTGSTMSPTVSNGLLHQEKMSVETMCEAKKDYCSYVLYDLNLCDEDGENPCSEVEKARLAEYLSIKDCEVGNCKTEVEKEAWEKFKNKDFDGDGEPDFVKDKDEGVDDSGDYEVEKDFVCRVDKLKVSDFIDVEFVINLDLFGFDFLHWNGDKIKLLFDGKKWIVEGGSDEFKEKYKSFNAVEGFGFLKDDVLTRKYDVGKIEGLTYIVKNADVDANNKITYLYEFDSSSGKLINYRYVSTGGLSFDFDGSKARVVNFGGVDDVSTNPIPNKYLNAKINVEKSLLKLSFGDGSEVSECLKNYDFRMLNLDVDFNSFLSKIDGFEKSSKVDVKIKNTINNLKKNTHYLDIMESLYLEAKKNDLDPLFIFSIIVQESGGVVDAQSGVGALGLMQLMPCTARDRGLVVNSEAYSLNGVEKKCENSKKKISLDLKDERLNPVKNIGAGIRQIVWLNKHFAKSDDVNILIGYNAGQGYIGKDTIPKETQNYIVNIEKYYEQLS